MNINSIFSQKERWWVTSAITAIILSGLLTNFTIIAVVSAILNVMCVILAAKAHKATYYFGAVAVLMYGFISYHQQYYGEMALNWFYFFPLQFIGYYVWQKNVHKQRGNNNTNYNNNNYNNNNVARQLKLNAPTWQVTRLYLGSIGKISIFSLVLLLSLIVGAILAKSDDPHPYVDALATICSIVAQLLMTLRYYEQWPLWILSNIASIYMWFMVANINKDSAPTIVMWIVYLLNSCYGVYLWRKKT